MMFSWLAMAANPAAAARWWSARRAQPQRLLLRPGDRRDHMRQVIGDGVRVGPCHDPVPAHRHQCAC
jgi:hypothetical protein